MPPQNEPCPFPASSQRVPEKILFLLRSCAPLAGDTVINSGNQHVWPFTRPRRRECSTIRASVPFMGWHGRNGRPVLLFVPVTCPVIAVELCPPMFTIHLPSGAMVSITGALFKCCVCAVWRYRFGIGKCRVFFSFFSRRLRCFMGLNPFFLSDRPGSSAFLSQVVRRRDRQIYKYYMCYKIKFKILLVYRGGNSLYCKKF
jgi:hypothetical protein